MDRDSIGKRLLQVERHIVRGEEFVARQQRIVDQLRLDGYNAADAEALLRSFTHLLATHVGERERLETCLSNLNAG